MFGVITLYMLFLWLIERCSVLENYDVVQLLISILICSCYNFLRSYRLKECREVAPYS